jgi:hypothetical protein
MGGGEYCPRSCSDHANPGNLARIPNTSGARLADVYIFAWHAGDDQRNVSQWQFYVVNADQLPRGQKSIGLRNIQKIVKAVQYRELSDQVAKMGG